MPRRSTGDRTVPRCRRSTAEVRNLILGAAEQAFTRHGYADTSTTAVARLAGVQRSVVYRHFGSKSGLFREAMAQPFVQFVENWTAPGPGAPQSDLPDALLMRHFIAGLHAHLGRHRDALSLLLRDDGLEPEMRQEVHTAIRDGLALIDDAVRENMRIRGFPIQHFDIAVRAVVSMVVGLIAVPADLFGDEDRDDDLVLSYVSAMVMHGLALRPGQPA